MELKIGIPAGSSVDPGRGGLAEILKKARIPIEGIGGGIPPTSTIGWLKPIIARPEEIPILAEIGMVDCYFCGADWVKEWSYSGVEADLVIVPESNSKETRIVYASNSDEPPRTVASEYVRIAKDYLENRFGESYPIFRVGENASFRGVMESAGKTEAKAFYGWVDGIVDLSQTGGTLKRFDLEEKETLLETRIGFYRNLRLDSEKSDGVDLIADMLKRSKPGYDYLVCIDRRSEGRFREYLRLKGFEFGSKKDDNLINFDIRNVLPSQSDEIISWAYEVTEKGMSGPEFY